MGGIGPGTPLRSEIHDGATVIVEPEPGALTGRRTQVFDWSGYL
jgi:hypothetical protein